MPQPKGNARKKTQAMTQRPLSIQYSPVASLKSDPHNPRIHSDKQVGQIARSIQIFGFNVPVLVDRDLNVIAGHGRVLASRLLEICLLYTSRCV